MKRLLVYTLLVFLASLVFYGGSGVNLVSYCCGHCEEEGVEALLEDKCCDIHEHAHKPLFTHASDFEHTHGCDIERVSFDWNSVNVQIPDLQPIAHDLCLFTLSPILQIPFQWTDTQANIHTTGPPIICPRTYLSLLTTLLI